MPLRTVHHRLAVLAAAGYVAKAGPGKWTLPADPGEPVNAPGLPRVPGEPPCSLTDAPGAERALVRVLVDLVAIGGGWWEGSARQLEARLSREADRDRDTALGKWLGSADRIGRALRRLAGSLRSAGVLLAFRRTGRGRQIVLRADG